MDANDEPMEWEFQQEQTEETEFRQTNEAKRCWLACEMFSLGIGKAYHFLRFDIPNLQAEAADNFHRMQGSGLGVLQLRDGGFDLRQAIKRDAGIEVVNVVIADVRGKPRHHRPGLEKTGGFQRGRLITPAGVITEGDPGKVVLGVEQIASNGASHEMRNDQREEQGRPAQQQNDRCRNEEMQDKSDQAIVMFAGIIDERIKTHSMEKDKDVPEQDGHGMPHEQIFKACRAG